MGREKTVVGLKPCVGELASGWTDLSRLYWHEQMTRQNRTSQRSV
jgi:hypothetical protein